MAAIPKKSFFWITLDSDSIQLSPYKNPNFPQFVDFFAIWYAPKWKKIITGSYSTC